MRATDVSLICRSHTRAPALMSLTPAYAGDFMLPVAYATFNPLSLPIRNLCAPCLRTGKSHRPQRRLEIIRPVPSSQATPGVTILNDQSYFLGGLCSKKATRHRTSNLKIRMAIRSGYPISKANGSCFSSIRKTTHLAERRKHVRSVMRTTNSKRKISSCLAFLLMTKRLIRNSARNTVCSSTSYQIPTKRLSKSTESGRKKPCTEKSTWA